MSESVIYKKIDTLDIAIIRELKKDSKRSAAEIARIIGANERTILRRIERLVENEIINFSIIVNPKFFGYILAVDIFLIIDSAREQETIDRLLKMPEIFYIATGQDNNSVSIHARFKDNETMFDYLYKTLPQLPGVSVKGFALIPRVIKTVDMWVPSIT